jgi:hypothetical protein
VNGDFVNNLHLVLRNFLPSVTVVETKPAPSFPGGHYYRTTLISAKQHPTLNIHQTNAGSGTTVPLILY